MCGKNSDFNNEIKIELTAGIISERNVIRRDEFARLTFV